MRPIVPEITSLLQYLNSKKDDPELYRPERCPHCGKSGLWSHGHYDRKAVRQHSDTLDNPIPILRFFCPFCGKTCSVLPECIPPHRWYLWEVQQIAFLLSFAGKSLAAIARTMLPSRHTISRWLARLKSRFRLHIDALCCLFIELGRTNDFTPFWKACFNKISLAKAMRMCHVAGVDIP